MIDGGSINVAFEVGKVLLDIELPSGSCAVGLSVSQCVEFIEELTQAVLSASTAAGEAR